MKIIVLSDLHIGQKGHPCNNFQLDDQLFADYLAGQSKIHDLIVLNGDVFELWEGIAEICAINGIKNLKELTFARFDAILASYPKTVEAIIALAKAEKLILINGNHDSMIRMENDRLLPGVAVLENKTISCGPYSVRFEHGHQGDAWCQDGSALSCLSWVSTQLKSTFDDLVTTKLDESFDLLMNTIDTSNEKIAIYAGKIGKAAGVDAVIFGHTHFAMLERSKTSVLNSNGVIYANSGKASDSDDLVDQIAITIEDKGDLVVERRIASVKTGSVTVKESLKSTKKW
jgi:UDP-2,3-diacylglucosamine pyrophosphatase LpxH